MQAALVLGAWPAFHLAPAAMVWWLLLVWASWLLLQGFLRALVRTGGVAVRFAQAPSSINNPDVRLRMLWHLLHNWSAVAVTALALWMLPGASAAVGLRWWSLGSVCLVWLVFNWQHRRSNRLQNLAPTSLLAATFAVAVLLAP